MLRVVIISWTLGEINWGEDRDGEVGSLGVRIELRLAISILRTWGAYAGETRDWHTYRCFRRNISTLQFNNKIECWKKTKNDWRNCCITNINTIRTTNINRSTNISTSIKSSPSFTQTHSIDAELENRLKKQCSCSNNCLSHLFLHVTTKNERMTQQEEIYKSFRCGPTKQRNDNIYQFLIVQMVDKKIQYGIMGKKVSSNSWICGTTIIHR